MARKTIKQRIALDGGKELQKELEQLGEKGAQAFKLLQEAADQVKGPSSAFLKSLDDAQKKLAEVGKRFRQIGDDIQKAGRSFSAAVTLPLAGAGTAIVKLAGDFEAAMNRVGAASKASADQINEAREQALKLGQDTPFSAREAADAMEVLVKNGLDMTQVLGGATDASLALAGATGSDLAGAADVATDVLQSFGKEVGALRPAVDQITGTLLQSKFGFEDYRLALGQAGGVAGGLGVSFEDFNAVLAATSNLFASGSDAGTSFKTFLTRLVPQSKDAAAAIEEYGLRFFDASGNMRTMAEVSEELRSKLSKLSDRELNEVLKDIFGVDAMRTAIGLMRQGAAGVEQFRAAIARGNAEEQAEARLKGFNGALEELMGSLETLAIRIADAGLLETVTNIVKALSDFVAELSETNPELLNFATQIAAVAAAIGPLLIGLGLMVSSVGTLLTPIRRAINGFAALTRAFGLFRAALISSGIGAAIALIGTGIALWLTHTDSATAAMERHQGVVGRVEEAYRKAGLQVAKMAQDVRDRLLIETRTALRETSRQLAEALQTARAELSQWDSDDAIDQPLLLLAKSFADGTLTVEQFQASVNRLAATDPRLDRLATEMLRVTDESVKLSTAVREGNEDVSLLEGKMSDAAYQSRRFADEQGALAAASTQANQKVEETAQQVEKLGKTITVHSGGANGPVKQTFELVDGIAKAVDASDKSLDDVSQSADAAGQKIGQVKDDISNLIVSVPEEMKGQPKPADVLTEGLDGAKEQLTQALSTIPAEAKTAVDGLITEVNRVQPAVQAAIGAGGGAATPGEDQAAAVSGIAESLAKPFEDARDRIAAALATVPTSVTTAIAGIQAATGEFGATLGTALVSPFETAGTRIAEILARMVSVVESQFAAMLSSVRSLTAQLQSAVAQLEALAARAEAAAARAAAAQAGASGRAMGGLVGRFAGGGQAVDHTRGGRVSGPGTGTSDSILARLSNGEFVMRFAAVKKYGLDLLYALNGLRLPKDFLKGFAGGGHVDLSGTVSRLTDGMRVPLMVPALADGGAVPAASGGRPINLNIGGEVFKMIAPDDVADRLAKHQSRQGLRQAGKRPRR